MPSLAGLHDLESVAIAPPGTWALATVALSDNPPPLDYPTSLNWIVRLNWAYGSGGTLPLPSVYEAFSELVAGYVEGCTGCRRWIIGNEPNLSREWPDNTPIYPWHYAACYKLCWQAIHALPGHANDEVLVAASGPWNDELKYNSNKNGDWIVYFTDVINLIGDACDGYSIHSYVHGYDVSLVTSSARMDRPFQNHFYEFYTYRDYCLAIPPELRYLPVYLTEANGNGPWQAVGLMPAMLQEIDSWNHSKLPKIHSVIFYRYPRYDQFYIEGRGDVMAEYQRAVALGYQAPLTPTMPPTLPPTMPPTPDRDIDPRLIARGVHFDFAKVPAGTGYWRIVKAFWLDEDEADAVGPDHHMLGTLLKNGRQKGDVPMRVEWPSGMSTLYSKHDDPNASYNYDYPMSSSLNEFSIRVDDGSPSDKASGIGMGAGGNPSVHTSTWIDWQWTISEGITVPEPPVPTPTPPATDRGLLWPVVGAPITQYFGQHEIGYPGSPGHDGIDYGVPVGSPVIAVADGIVKWVANDPSGFGLYIRIFHPAHSFHSFLGHLSRQLVTPGQRVTQGETIGLSGSTGNSTGPHLHYSCRIGEEDTYFDLHDGYANGCANPLAVHGLINRSDPNMREEA